MCVCVCESMCVCICERQKGKEESDLVVSAVPQWIYYVKQCEQQTAPARPKRMN